MKHTIAVIASLLWLNSMAAFAEGTPKLQFDQTTYDIGTTSPVAAVTGKFTFRNAGDGVLQVQKPTSTCGCTVPSVTPDTYKPGEKGEVTFTLNLSNARGPFEKHITVPSNDPQNPAVKLTVKAEVKPIFEVSPPQVSLGDLQRGETRTVTIQVKRLDGKRLAITKTAAAQDFITVKATAQPADSAPGQAAQVTVEAKAGDQPRRFSDMLNVYTDGASEPALRIPIIGRVLGDITLQPEALTWLVQNPTNWPGQNAELTTTRRVRVSATRPEPSLELRNVTSGLKELSVEVVTVNTGQTYELVAKLTQPPKESVRAVISFETNLPTQPKMEVPVMITVLNTPATGHTHSPAK
ncbi:MAG: hypothetical protein PCFJNLEI_01196 [Verrucomicrobiae bacterium]|nr:hypothetical protein [Verrucomicrobiae bacterium]